MIKQKNPPSDLIFLSLALYLHQFVGSFFPNFRTSQFVAVLLFSECTQKVFSWDKSTIFPYHSFSPLSLPLFVFFRKCSFFGYQCDICLCIAPNRIHITRIPSNIRKHLFTIDIYRKWQNNINNSTIDAIYLYTKLPPIRWMRSIRRAHSSAKY